MNNEPDHVQPTLFVSLLAVIVLTLMVCVGLVVGAPPVSHSEQGGPDTVSHWPLDRAPVIMNVAGLFIVGLPDGEGGLEWTPMVDAGDALDMLEQAGFDLRCQRACAVLGCDSGSWRMCTSGIDLRDLLACYQGRWAECGAPVSLDVTNIGPCMDMGCAMDEWTYWVFEDACNGVSAPAAEHPCDWFEFTLSDCPDEC